MNDSLFIVMLERQERLDPELVVPLLTTAGMTRQDAIRACRRQRGVLLTRVDEELAGRVALELTQAGIGATAFRQDEVVHPEPQTSVAHVRVDEAGLALPLLEAIGKPAMIEWPAVRLLIAGIVDEQGGAYLDQVGDMVMAGGTGHEDHVALARARTEVWLNGGRFPLSRFLNATPECLANPDRIRPGGKAGTARRFSLFRRRERFTLPPEPARYTLNDRGLCARLLLWDGLSFYSLDGRLALYSGAVVPAGHWLKRFHALVVEIVKRADHALIPPDTRAFAEGREDGVYLFEDSRAVDEYCQWWLNGPA